MVSMAKVTYSADGDLKTFRGRQDSEGQPPLSICHSTSYITWDFIPVPKKLRLRLPHLRLFNFAQSSVVYTFPHSCEMTLADAYGAFMIVGIVSLSTLLAELFSYVLVYNTEDYVRACDRVRELNKKLDKEDRKVVSVEKRKSHEKAVDRLEEELKQASQKMDGLRLRSNILIGVAFLFLYRMVAASWTGHVVARLPFLPIKLIQPLSFRGLKGDDYYQCSFGFIYTLSTMGIKANIPRLLGFTPPKSRMDAARMAAKQQRKSNVD